MTSNALNFFDTKNFKNKISHAISNSLANDFFVMGAVSIAHFIFFALLLLKVNQTTDFPVLSFSVSVFDVSSSNNTVATQASSESDKASKKSVSEISENASMQSFEKNSKEEAEENNKTKISDKKSVSSEQQTAVIAPTTPAIYDAAYLNNEAPNYPALSKRLGEEGIVLLSVYVNEKGQAEKVEIKNSSGYRRLDNAAVDAVKNWKFIAAKNHANVVASWVQIPVNFVLEKNHG